MSNNKIEIKKYQFESFIDKENPIIKKNDISDINKESEEPIKIDNIISPEYSLEQENKIEEIEPNNIEIQQIDSKKEEITDKDLINILENINILIDNNMKNNQNNIENIIKDLSNLSIIIAKKIAIAALKDNPLAEIETFFRNSLKFFQKENELKIILNTEMIDKMKSRIEELLPGFIMKNSISFESNSNYNIYDCSIEWNNGGVDFDKDEVIKKIEQFF
jgi:hypothetical protein